MFFYSEDALLFLAITGIYICFCLHKHLVGPPSPYIRKSKHFTNPSSPLRCLRNMWKPPKGFVNNLLLFGACLRLTSHLAVSQVKNNGESVIVCCGRDCKIPRYLKFYGNVFIIPELLFNFIWTKIRVICTLLRFYWFKELNYGFFTRVKINYKATFLVTL